MPDETNPTATDAQPGQAAPAPTTPPATAPATAPEQPTATFSQADVDRIVTQRLERERQKLTQTSTDAVAAVEAKLAELTANLEAERTRARDNAVRGAVLAAAATHGAVSPDQVFALLDRTGVTVSDDGSVAGAGDAVKAFLEANPHFVGKAPKAPGSVNGGARTPVAPASPQQLANEALAQGNWRGAVSAETSKLFAPQQ